MKLFKYISFLLMGLLLMPSCEKTLDEINQDPSRLSSVEMRLMLPEILSQSAYNKGATVGRAAGLITQQFVGIDAQQIQIYNYVLGEDAFNNYWQTGLYAGVLRSCKVLTEKAEEEGAPFYSGVAKIIMANEYALAASMFGDIPFSQALLGTENTKPDYDAQESVYIGVQAMLTDAISDLNQGAGYVGGDLIFDGDAALWIATANALKARYAMHLVKRDANKASTDALSAIGGAITSTSTQPNFAFGSAQIDNWSLAKFGIERTATLAINNGFADLMIAKDDTLRQETYMEFDGSDWTFFNLDNPKLVWGRSDAVIPLISYAEVKFLEAEALVRTNGPDADVQAALEAAITASMEMVGVTDPDYIAEYADLAGLSSEEKIQRIIEEAYVAYYGHNFLENWTNYRRTGYPDLTPPALGVNGFNPSGVVPRRFLYVASETQTNMANVQAARARQNGGLLDADTWAFE